MFSYEYLKILKVHIPPVPCLTKERYCFAHADHTTNCYWAVDPLDTLDHYQQGTTGFTSMPPPPTTHRTQITITIPNII